MIMGSFGRYTVETAHDHDSRARDGVPPAQRGGADGGGQMQGERAVLREAGGDSTAERPSGRGPAAGGALTDARHGEQPGAERGRR
jgi:hypothetical protein